MHLYSSINVGRKRAIDTIAIATQCAHFKLLSHPLFLHLYYANKCICHAHAYNIVHMVGPDNAFFWKSLCSYKKSVIVQAQWVVIVIVQTALSWPFLMKEHVHVYSKLPAPLWSRLSLECIRPMLHPTETPTVYGGKEESAFKACPARGTLYSLLIQVVYMSIRFSRLPKDHIQCTCIYMTPH